MNTIIIVSVIVIVVLFGVSFVIRNQKKMHEEELNFLNSTLASTTKVERKENEDNEEVEEGYRGIGLLLMSIIFLGLIGWGFYYYFFAEDAYNRDEVCSTTFFELIEKPKVDDNVLSEEVVSFNITTDHDKNQVSTAVIKTKFNDGSEKFDTICQKFSADHPKVVITTKSNGKLVEKTLNRQLSVNTNWEEVE